MCEIKRSIKKWNEISSLNVVTGIVCQLSVYSSLPTCAPGSPLVIRTACGSIKDPNEHIFHALALSLSRFNTSSVAEPSSPVKLHTLVRLFLQ